MSYIKPALLVFVTFAVLPIAGCKPQDANVAQITLPGTLWSAERIAGDVIPSGIEITLNFGRDGRLHGSAGCNRYFSDYNLKTDALTLGPIGATRKLCPDLQMTAEKRFLAALGKVNSWAVKDGKLVLFGTGAELTFVKSD